ncbi:unnamed protein product [Bemisia tabaci]|uniref:AD domain-containing protein n=1 Tax=Bemisia tabaci TaxID=7038 RepID=A0A9P0A899_BEMTA|nr:unnamed protein product [Bemisia tabaci]
MAARSKESILDDPLYYLDFVQKFVQIKTLSDKVYQGTVVTVDPKSDNVVLVSHSDGKPCIDIIMGHSVQSIQICSQASGSSLQWSLGENLLKCLEDSDESAVSVEELSARKQRLKVWLSKNLITVTEEGNLLKLDDVLVIHPPYGVKQCTSSNQIILGKVQTLVQKLYSQSPS